MTLRDIYLDMPQCFEEEKPRFFQLIGQYINWGTRHPRILLHHFLQENGVQTSVFSRELYLHADIAKTIRVC